MDEILWHRRETRRHRENKPRPVAAGASGLLEGSRWCLGSGALGVCDPFLDCTRESLPYCDPDCSAPEPVELTSLCGNGRCDTAAGETRLTCAEDCRAAATACVATTAAAARAASARAARAAALGAAWRSPSAVTAPATWAKTAAIAPTAPTAAAKSARRAAASPRHPAACPREPAARAALTAAPTSAIAAPADSPALHTGFCRVRTSAFGGARAGDLRGISAG
jgi:hypothetical protein